MKEGLVYENDELVYYKHGTPYHAGVIQVDGDIYYINAHGRAIKGQHIVHEVMANDLLKKGTYTFGEDYKLVKGSYIAPKKRKKARKIISAKKPKMGKRKIKKLTKQWIPVVLGVACLALLIFLLPGVGQYRPPVNGTDPNGTQNNSSVIILPTFDSEVLLCNSVAKSVFDHETDIANAIAYGNPYQPFVFTYQLNKVSGTLYLSEHADLSNAEEYPLPADKTSLIIDNLKTSTEYFYLVRVGEEEYPGSFRTARSVRYINVPGAVNIRDIGGYTTLDGKIVKQGLLIRGVELDGLVNSAYFPSAADIEKMQNTFGFVYEMDLRSSSIFGGIYASRFGSDVAHKFYDSPQYGQIFSQNYIPELKAIFHDLSDPAKYPMYLHCTWGRDRTGTIIFLLQGILNISEEDMLLEYEQTGYFDAAIIDSYNLEVIISSLASYAGNTLQEKIVSFLTTEVGVTEAEIQSIRSIFLETPAN